MPSIAGEYGQALAESCRVEGTLRPLGGWPMQFTQGDQIVRVWGFTALQVRETKQLGRGLHLLAGRCGRSSALSIQYTCMCLGKHCGALCSGMCATLVHLDF